MFIEFARASQTCYKHVWVTLISISNGSLYLFCCCLDVVLFGMFPLGCVCVKIFSVSLIFPLIFSEANVLQCIKWRVNESQFPKMAVLARKILAVVGSSWPQWKDSFPQKSTLECCHSKMSSNWSLEFFLLGYSKSKIVFKLPHHFRTFYAILLKEFMVGIKCMLVEFCSISTHPRVERHLIITNSIKINSNSKRIFEWPA